MMGTDIPEDATIDIRGGKVYLRRADGVGVEVEYRTAFEDGPISFARFRLLLQPIISMLLRDSDPDKRCRS